MRVWETSSWKPLARLEHRVPVMAPAFDGTGRWLLTGLGDGTARLWRAETCDLVHVLKGYEAPVEAVWFREKNPGERPGTEEIAGPDATLCTSASMTFVTREWSGRTGALLFKTYLPLESYGRNGTRSPFRCGESFLREENSSLEVWILDRK